MRPNCLSVSRDAAAVCAALFLSTHVSAGETGKMTREVWFDIDGGQLTNFTTSPRYWQPADAVGTMDGAVAPSDTVDRFAARIRGYVTAPVTGNYTFWIASDDDSELYLSTTDSKFQRVKIASLSGYVSPQEWDFRPSQKSVLIPLVAGQVYFTEALHKDGVYGDHLAIAWQTPGGVRELIPASALESFTADPNDLDTDELPDDWETAYGFSLTDNGTLYPDQHPLADPNHDGKTNLEQSRLGTDPRLGAGNPVGLPGKLTREVWSNIPGGQLANFTTSPRYWQAADTVSTFAGAATPVDTGDAFAARIRGYITVPVSGDYTFWVASDDDSELYLSTDGSKFNRAKIASLSGYVNPFDWDVRPSQKSAPLALVAGRRYFIVALHKDGVFGDHLEIAWQAPAGIRQVIPAYALESFNVDANDLDRDELPDDWESAHGFSVAVDAAGIPDQHPLADPDHDGYSNLEESTFGTDPFVHGGIPGYLLLETWLNLPGINMTDLTWNPRFLTAPDRSEFVYSAETPLDRADNYGARMRGYIIAPVTGDYTFFLSGDDACELWLSPSENQFAMQKIASQPTWSDLREWTKFPTQKSAVIPLVGGRKYYLEALQKELFNGDHLEVGWTLPGSKTVSIIPGPQLESYAYDRKDPDGDNMPSNWELDHGLDPAVNDAALDPDFDGIPNGHEYADGTNPQTKTRFTGALLHELWWNTPAYSVHSPVAELRRLQPPDQHTLAFSTQGPVNYAEAYTDRYRGYLTAPVTGSYTFWAIGDEETEFYLSTSANKFKKELLVHPGPQIRDFDADLSMKSRAVTLQAGERYYLEILHINHHGGDFCEVAWQVPGAQREIIPGSVLSSYAPVANDQDDDDLPDDWELANGLDPTDNGHINPKNGAQGDLDWDGLSNEEERKAGTRADLADTDGDGVNDRDEVEMMETQALTPDAAPFQSAAIIPGAAYTTSSGQWIRTGDKAKQDCVRGSLDYPVTLASAGVYELDLTFTPVVDAGVSPDYEIVFSVDGKTIRRENVTVAEQTIGHAKILSPWLAAGSHTLRVFIDNSYYFRRVTVDQLEILAARGPDADANGTPDWVDVQLAKRNSFKAPAKSITSPVCLEGKARWCEMTTIAGQPVQAAPDDMWFTNILLDASQPTSIAASLENGAVADSRQIKWVPVNLLDTPALTIRQGDSLQLTAFTGIKATAAQSVTLTVEGQTVTIPATQPQVHAFSNAGSFPIAVSHRIAGVTSTAAVLVTVIAAPTVISPVCVVGFYREAEIPALPQGISLQMDERIQVRETTLFPGGNARHILRLNTLADRCALFRLGGLTGPVLGTLPFRAMRVRSADSTAVFVEAELGNDTYQLGMPIIVDGLYPDVTVEYDIFIAGVTFDDGSLRKVLSIPSDFDANGERMLHFLKVGTAGSNCHRSSIWQRRVQIGISR